MAARNQLIIKSLIIFIYSINSIIIFTINKQMKYLAAYALLSLSGKKDITANDIKKVIGEVKANVSDDDLNRMIASVKGKNITQLIADGNKKIGSSAPATTGKSEAKPKEKEVAKKKVEPKKQQVEPEPEDEDMGLGGGLFD